MAGIFSFLSRTASAEPVDPMAQQAADIRALKQEAIARAAADAANDKRMPTITDYFIACEMIGEERREAFALRGMHWNVRVYADLSNQTLNGYLIRQEDVAPPADIRQAATIRAKEIAAFQNRTVTMLDYLQAIKVQLDAMHSTRKAS